MAFMCPEITINFPHLMVDTETLSTANNAAIISICAVPFNPQLGTYDSNYFYQEIDHDSLELFHKCPHTIDWWTQQTTPMPKGTTPIKVALDELRTYFCKQPYTAIWANSPSFDITILRNAFNTFKITWPFPYWLEHDVRTIKQVFKLPNLQNSHHAYKDCLNQINLVTQVYSILASKDSQS